MQHERSGLISGRYGVRQFAATRANLAECSSLLGCDAVSIGK
jgi:hypothetical protein